MENNFVYAILSYNRSERQLTVNYLQKIGIKKEQIFVFVQTEEDKKKYEEIIGNFAQIILKEASRGVEARNNILNELIDKTNVMMLDDDISAIGQLNGSNEIVKIEDGETLNKTFGTFFELCEKSKVKMFGIYPVFNDFYMERSISTKAPINTVFGILKGFKERFNEEYDTKEDAEICARILRTGRSIFRFNSLAVEADHRKTKNGYIDDWHQEENVRCVKRITREYPTVYKEQKGKPWEVRCIIKDKKIKF